MLAGYRPFDGLFIILRLSGNEAVVARRSWYFPQISQKTHVLHVDYTHRVT